MARQEAVQLDVEREPPGRDLGPARDRLLGRDRVEARVELDVLEALRVPGEPVARGEPARIPVLYEAGVRPAGGADEDPAGHRCQGTTRAGASGTFELWTS